MPAFLLCRISAGIVAFGWKIAEANLNSQQKFYDNGANPVLRRLLAISAELPTIGEN